MFKSLALAVLPCFFYVSGLVVHSQTQPLTQEKPKESDAIPVTDKLTIEKCAGCHKRDEKGALTRISHERLTPEGWQQAIKRMVRPGITVKRIVNATPSAQVPDHLNNYPDWTSKCASATKDWRKIDLVFP
jgi:hypothetical protein